MDLSTASFDDIVHALYDAISVPGTWSVFFDRVGQAVDARTVHLIALDKTHAVLSYSDGYALPVDGELDYIQHYGKIDPRRAALMEFEVGRWMHCHELFDEEFVSHNAFYQDFLIPLGRRYVSGVKLVDDEQTCVIFSILRGVEDSPLGVDETAFLSRLTPHLMRAVKMQMQQFIFSAKSLVGHALVDRLRQPVLLLTSEGTVVHSNVAAQTLMKRTSLVKIEDGRLTFPRKEHEFFFNECKRLEGRARQAALPDANDLQCYQALTLTKTPGAQSPGETLYTFFSILVPAQVSGTFGLRPLFMLVFYHPESAPPVDVNILAVAFNLTPAEARVCRLIADGKALKEVARALGTQHETVRKQLQSVYRKTATNRQSELMSLMLHLPANAFTDSSFAV